MISLLPSLPAEQYESIIRLVNVLQGESKEIQIDIVDGRFAPSISWPFTEIDPRSELRKLAQVSREIDIELDCMIDTPENYLSLLSEIPIKRLIIHMGSTTEFDTILDFTRKHIITVGLAFTNDASFDDVQTLIPRFDFIQIMGIKQVGKQGEPFDTRTYETVRKFRSQFPKLQICIDGGVNRETIPNLLHAGADRFAPGSAITRADDPKRAFIELMELTKTLRE